MKGKLFSIIAAGLLASQAITAQLPEKAEDISPLKFQTYAGSSSESLTGQTVNSQEAQEAESADKLVMLWISDDIDAAEKMAFMYAHTAKKAGWFQEVTVIIWGPSAKLISENEKLQEKVKAMQADGVKVEACVACARQYGVDGKLRELGYDVKGMGTHLTNYLKSDAKVISF